MPEETSTIEVQASNETTVATPPASETTSPSTPCGQKNTLGLVALILSVVGLLLLISIIGSPIGILLLVIALIMGIVAVFKTPKGKAIASIVISFIPLGMIAYIICLISTLTPNVVEDYVFRGTEVYENPVYKEVLGQPGFNEFFNDKLENRFESIDRKAVRKRAPHNISALVPYYSDFTLNEIKTYFPTIVDMWIAQYGLPETLPENEGPETGGVLENTSRTLSDFDGEAVQGTYTLTFGVNNLSAKLCNTINGNFSITDHVINAPMLMSTQMFCTDEEANTLEAAFNPDGATFSIASTRMLDNNIERLAITTSEGHIFLYTKDQAPIGGETDEHGCYLSAGYSRNEEAQECQRPWEQTQDNPQGITPEGINILIDETTGGDVIKEVETILNNLDENN